MSPGLSPSERSTNAALAAHERWSREDAVAGTARARANGPGSLDYWLDRVDPHGELTAAERDRRARNAKTAFCIRLAKRSAAVRKAKSSRAVPRARARWVRHP